MPEQAFASVLNLDRRAIKALAITDHYSIHRVVYSLFEDVRSAAEKTASTSSGIVYADQGGNTLGRQILILSNRIPRPTTPEGYGEVKTKNVPTAFWQKEHYRFKVAINPCRRENKSRRLIPVKGRNNIAQWFLERSEKSWGFCPDPLSLQVDKVEVLSFEGKNGRRIQIAKAHIQGSLQVVNKQIFARSFLSGIGRARAFGCGLLQIVPQNISF